MTETPATKCTWASVVSDVFSPLLAPTYAMILAMWITPLRVLPESGRLIATAVVALYTAVVPFMAIMTLMKLGRVSNFAITDRAQRLLPFSIAVVCYGCAAWTIHSYHAPMWLVWFFIAAAVATSAALVINTVWKISAHATALGGVTGMLTWCTTAGMVDTGSMLWLTGAIVISGLVCTARLRLARHTLEQVTAGFVLGFAVTLALMSIA